MLTHYIIWVSPIYFCIVNLYEGQCHANRKLNRNIIVLSFVVEIISFIKILKIIVFIFSENTCGHGEKQSLHLNNPAIFIFNSTVNSKFPCHLELHLHSQSLGFSVFIETLKIGRFLNSDCSQANKNNLLKGIK